MFAGGRVRRVRVKTVLDVGREQDDREWNLDQEVSRSPGEHISRVLGPEGLIFPRVTGEMRRYKVE